MKLTKRYLAFVTAAGLALGLTACGDDVTKVTEGTPVMAVETEANLPACNADNNGSFVIAKDKQKVFVCYSESWFALNSDGSPADSAKTAPKASDGKNGTNGTNGNSCTGVAFESGDSTGFKIVCGKDTLGVVLSGKDGINGRNGRHAVVQGLAKTLAKRMKRGINIDFFANPVKDFKTFNENGLEDKSFGIYMNNKLYAYDEIRKSHFEEIAKVGFDHVRIQVRWENHYQGDSSKCLINPEYMKQIKWAVENSINNGLIAVVNEHYLAYLQTNDSWQRGNGYSYKQISPCLKSIYSQVADAMSGYSTDSLLIELPNEPNLEPSISAKQWNDLADSLIQIVHEQDPARVIIVGPRNYYSKDYLNELQLDNPDGLLMVTFHYYDPTTFSIGNSGESWNGTKNQKMTIYSDFEKVAQWSKTHGNIPIYLGEYGTSCDVTDVESIEKWLAAITSIADHFGFATAMHEFGGFFFAYSLKDKKWLDYKLRPLFNSQETFAPPDRPDLSTISQTTLEDFGTEFNKLKLFDDLGKSNWWYFYNSCNGSTCDTVVTTNASGTRFRTAQLKDFKTSGHTGDGLYMKHVINAPSDVYPGYGFAVHLTSLDENLNDVYLDLSKMKALSFWAKGQGQIKVVLSTAFSDSVAATSSIPNWLAGFYDEFELTNQWTKYIVWADELVPEKGTKLETIGGEWDKTRDRVSNIEFKHGSKIDKGTKATVEWYLDDITIHGMALSDF